MKFSDALQRLIRQGSFPLKDSLGRSLWNELISALESNAKVAVGAIKALHEGQDYGVFGDTVLVNGIAVNPGLNDLGMLLGAMHAALMTDFDIYNRKGDTSVKDLATRVRNLAVKHKIIGESGVSLGPVSPHHGMGTSLATTSQLTFVGDPSVTDRGGFGSQPDQKLIGIAAPQWLLLKKRRHVSQATLAIGRKPHYVLAHLLNHQVNGSGRLETNVVPFSADGNTRMANEVEGALKEAVHRGLTVKYDIDVVGQVGMTPGRTQALAECTTQEQRDIIEIEQYLPVHLSASLKVLQSDGTWLTIFAGYVIANHVPETVPVT